MLFQLINITIFVQLAFNYIYKFQFKFQVKNKWHRFLLWKRCHFENSHRTFIIILSYIFLSIFYTNCNKFRFSSNIPPSLIFWQCDLYTLVQSFYLNGRALTGIAFITASCPLHPSFKDGPKECAWCVYILTFHMLQETQVEYQEYAHCVASVAGI